MLNSRIARLQAAMETGKNQALAEFWAELEALGTPLFEPVAHDSSQMWVTFVWHGTSKQRNVIMFNHIQHYQEGFTLNQFTRLGETDLWYYTCQLPSDLCTTYWFSPDDSLKIWAEFDDWAVRAPNFQADPLNPHQFSFDDGQNQKLSILAGPQSVKSDWLIPNPIVPVGNVEKHFVQSTILNNKRPVWVYTPYNYQPKGKSYDLLLLFDGASAIEIMSIPTILDNLIAANKIPPTIVLMPDYAQPEDRAIELPCHPPFFEFITDELLGWLRQLYNVTTDPARAIVSGISYGGLAAAYTGLKYSHLFGKVLSQSGSFWWKPRGESAPEWLTKQFLNTSTLPLKFYLEAGHYESNVFSNSEISLLEANRRLRDTLQAKGYSVNYNEFMGCHEYVSWRNTFANGLLSLY